MELGLSDRRALVMGSTRGIGFGIADRLAAEGARVAVCGRKKASADEAASKIDGATGYALDLGDAASVDRLIASVEADFGGLDIIVCNGGGPPPGSIAEVTPEVWEAQFQSMFVNQVRIVGAFLGPMRERQWGRVLIVASSGVIQPIVNLGISNALRSSLLAWAKTLAGEVAADGVTVNTILPGRIQTSRVDQIDAAAAERQGKPVADIVSASQAAIPARRYGTVEEIADVGVFLLSDRASYVTGGITRVDGGMIRSV